MIQPPSRQRLYRALVAGAGLAGIVALALWLHAAFQGRIHVSSVAFTAGPLSVRWYGLLIAFSILLSLPWAVARARRAGLDPHRAEAAYWWGVVGGAVGARLVYVVQNLDYYGHQPAVILAIADGGLSIHGMILGGLVAGALAARALGLSFWLLADAAGPAMLAGMVLGRFGNFTNMELIGYPTSVPWKMFVPPPARPPLFTGAEFFHPVFLYDAILNCMLLALLLATERTVRFPGELIFRLLAGIAVTRFIVEFWRIGDRVLGPLSLAQLASVLIFTVAVTVLWLGRRGKLATSAYLITQ